MKKPGGPYQIGKALRALFSPRKVYSRGLHKAIAKTAEGCEQYDKRKTDKSCEIYTWAAEVNQN